MIRLSQVRMGYHSVKSALLNAQRPPSPRPINNFLVNSLRHCETVKCTKFAKSSLKESGFYTQTTLFEAKNHLSDYRLGPLPTVAKKQDTISLNPKKNPRCLENRKTTSGFLRKTHLDIIESAKRNFACLGVQPEI